MTNYNKCIFISFILFLSFINILQANPTSTINPCQKAWERLPDALKQKIEVGELALEPEKAFMTKCEELQESLIEDLKGNTDSIIRKTFLTWLAEKTKEQLMPTLSPEAQKNFDPDSAYIQEKALEWLEQPGHEISTYVNAFILEKSPFIANIAATWQDLSSGESAEILKNMKALLNKSQERLNTFLEAKKEIEEKPDVPYTEILEKYGFSGKWLDNFKAYEGSIRAFDSQYNAKEILTVTISAFQSNDSKEKIAGMLSLIDSVSSVASNSKIPIVSLVGYIINNLAKVSQDMLKAVLNLGEILKKRAGYCVGVGVPGDDRRSQILNQEGKLACPLSFNTLPFKNIYETVIPVPGELLFWTGETFIPGHVEGGGKSGLMETLSFMRRAKNLNYAIDLDNIEVIANVYNVKGGIPALLREATEVILGIKNKAERLQQLIGSQGHCSKETIINYVEKQTHFQLHPFLAEDTSDLITTYAASYVAKTDAFGANNTRTNAYLTYKTIWEQLKNLTVVNVYGEIRESKNREVICRYCANAIIDISLQNAEEIKGCETLTADKQGNFTLHLLAKNPNASVILKAYTSLGNSDSYPLTLNAERQSITLFIHASEQSDCEKMNALLEKINAIYATDKAKAENYLAEARALKCDKYQEALNNFATIIIKDNSDKEELALSDCDVNKLQQLLSDKRLTPEKKIEYNALYSNINQANQILNQDVASTAQLDELILKHKTLLEAVKPCKTLSNALQNSLKPLEDLQHSIIKVNEANTRCDKPFIKQILNDLASFKQTLSEHWKATLKERLNQLDQAENNYSNGVSAYKTNHYEESLSSLMLAKKLFQHINCMELSHKTEKAIAIVSQAQQSKLDPYKALQGCYLSIVEKTLLQIQGNPNYRELEGRLYSIRNGNKQLIEANTLYKAGHFQEATNLLNKAKITLAGQCPRLENLINDSLEKIANQELLVAAIKQAIKDCDQETIKKFLAHPDKMKPFIPQLESALLNCDKNTSPEELLRKGTILCKENLGEAAFAIKLNTDGTVQCGCEQGYFIDGTNHCAKPSLAEGHKICQKKAGVNAEAIHINANGTYECRCNKNYQFNKDFTQCIRISMENGQKHCKSLFGANSYAVKINANGTYECGCKKGFIFNKNFTQCAKITIQHGHDTCRKSFGPGSYAVKINADTTFQCQCKSGYLWNEKKTQCIIPKKKPNQKQPIKKSKPVIEPLPEIDVRIKTPSLPKDYVPWSPPDPKN
ncbi:hypothetical protein [Legionella oakridgensis]|nr:hypothetical protein [Legionella oakridgensis]KTD44531.1 Calcium-binding EGF domain protein [Legionella oakridgensis]STY21058.1 Calcium-binding EGF domain [Legionella longbeachae]